MADDPQSGEGEHSDVFVDPLGDLEDPAPQIQEESPEGPSLAALTGSELGSELDLPGGSAREATEDLAQDVQQMIDSALPEEPIAAAPLSLAPELEHPDQTACQVYSVTLRGIENPADQRRVQTVLDRLAILPEGSPAAGAAHSGVQRWSRLSEFQAYVLMANLFPLGFDVRLGQSEDSPAAAFAPPPEALTNVAAPEPEMGGALPVALPTKEGEVFLSTTESIAGHHAQVSKGIVTAHGVIHRLFFREGELDIRMRQKLQELGPQPSGQAPRRQLPRAEMDKIFANLLQKLQREAFRRGANGVVGIRIAGFTEAAALDPDADQIRLIATGTAVLLQTESGN